MTIVSFVRDLWRKEDSGATAVEFAIVLSVLVYFVFGIVDIGLMMVASQEVNAAAESATRQLRTGAIQSVYAQVQSSNTASTPDTSGACNAANVTSTSSNTNCLGITVSPSDSIQTIFNNVLQANILDGGSIVKYANFGYNIQIYNDWSEVSTSGHAFPTLQYNSDGSLQTLFVQSVKNGAQGAITQDIVVIGVIGYRYPFFTPFIGCIFNPSACTAGKIPNATLSSFQVFQAEPFGTD